MEADEIHFASSTEKKITDFATSFDLNVVGSTLLY